jgi:hypothetical protein
MVCPLQYLPLFIRARFPAHVGWALGAPKIPWCGRAGVAKFVERRSRRPDDLPPQPVGQCFRLDYVGLGQDFG